MEGIIVGTVSCRGVATIAKRCACAVGLVEGSGPGGSGARYFVDAERLDQHAYRRSFRGCCRLLGALRAGCVVVNCSPLYTAHELGAQLADSGAEAIVVLENFAAVLQQALPGTMVKHVIVTQIGDMLGWPKGPLVNFSAKYLKRLAPVWNIPNAHRFREALKKGAGLDLSPAEINGSDTRFCNIPAARQAFQKAQF